MFYSGEHMRLAELCNRCLEGKEEDVESFLLGGADILGIKLPAADADNARAALAEVFKRIAMFKMSGYVRFEICSRCLIVFFSFLV